MGSVSLPEKAKARYKIKNWRDYNTALKQRGSITIWLPEEGGDTVWYSPPSGKQGRQCIYSDQAIICALTLRAVFHLPLRAVQGFIESLFSLGKIALKCPDYSILSRRAGDLKIKLPASSSVEPLNIVMDSTGLKVYGEGEWKVRQHGISKRRTWRKLHLAIDRQTGEIVAAELTINGVSDDHVCPDLSCSNPAIMFKRSLVVPGFLPIHNCPRLLQPQPGRS
jgi:Transposase DDE domain